MEVIWRWGWVVWWHCFLYLYVSNKWCFYIFSNKNDEKEIRGKKLSDSEDTSYTTITSALLRIQNVMYSYCKHSDSSREKTLVLFCHHSTTERDMCDTNTGLFNREHNWYYVHVCRFLFSSAPREREKEQMQTEFNLYFCLNLNLGSFAFGKSKLSLTILYNNVEW